MCRCKVELISRSDLLNARGFKGSSLEITAYSVMVVDIDGDIDFTISQVYQDLLYLMEMIHGDDSDGDNNNDGGGNPPIAADFQKR